MIQITDRQAEEMLRIMRKSYWEMRQQKCSLVTCNQLARITGMLERRFRNGKKKV